MQGNWQGIACLSLTSGKGGRGFCQQLRNGASARAGNLSLVSFNGQAAAEMITASLLCTWSSIKWKLSVADINVVKHILSHLLYSLFVGCLVQTHIAIWVIYLVAYPKTNQNLLKRSWSRRSSKSKQKLGEALIEYTHFEVFPISWPGLLSYFVLFAFDCVCLRMRDC